MHVACTESEPKKGADVNGVHGVPSGLEFGTKRLTESPGLRAGQTQKILASRWPLLPFITCLPTLFFVAVAASPKPAFARP